MIATTAKRGYRRVKCDCVTRWMGDIGYGDGPLTALQAATCSGMGIQVRLASFPKSGMRLIQVPGIQYHGAREYIETACAVCGCPTKIGTSS